MKINEIVDALGEQLLKSINMQDSMEKSVSGITSMYQDIEPGHVFMLKNSATSAYYFDAASANTPAFIITDFEVGRFDDRDVPVVYVEDFMKAANKMAEFFYGESIKKLKYIAVTGTNGKTTVSHFIGRLLSNLGCRTATVGTLGIFDDSYQKVPFRHTTPTTPMHLEFAEIIKHFADRDYDYIVYEATSIALDQQRTDFIWNDMAIFNNFSPEHIEYHGTVEAYLSAKLKLAERSTRVIANADVPEYAALTGQGRHFSKSPGTYYHYQTELDHVNLSIGGSSYMVSPGFIGEHNYINLATAVFGLVETGFSAAAVTEASRGIQAPVHRFELFSEGSYDFVLDFAHTPVAINEAILNALKYARAKGKNLMVMVTGIGLRGQDKIKMTMEMLPEDIPYLILAAEQVGYEDEEMIVQMMRKHLPESYNNMNIITAFSRQEGIVQAIEHADEDTLILLTGINEPQNYRGGMVAHDDREFISSYVTGNLNKKG
ncbi:UDP-N-acetylmuramoyl-L-alanyl-D-glutamate--2,6-diaminopimelate ligase [Salinicoccus jeotgali]|uniref:UDP-N-acetylmuramoyl-L-alanyl-D-glutamate--2, 6-diaminopimelate ligase n=1 Tax=Salinicoccus jeotgali TaxID=381634 RepID=A0ABP7F8I0_9STAP